MATTTTYSNEYEHRNFSRKNSLSMARAENPQTALDDAEIILEGVRGLATSKERCTPLWRIHRHRCTRSKPTA